MCRIYEEALLPSACDMFGNQSHSWLLQEDNDPKHTSLLCRKWKEENGVEKIDWPSSSPDLNPIENVWGLLKNRIRRRNPRSVQQLKKSILLEWSAMDDQLAKNLVISVSRRLLDVIDVEGDSILY